jgi:hypothetical protein
MAGGLFLGDCMFSGNGRYRSRNRKLRIIVGLGAAVLVSTVGVAVASACEVGVHDVATSAACQTSQSSSATSTSRHGFSRSGSAHLSWRQQLRRHFASCSTDSGSTSISVSTGEQSDTSTTVQNNMVVPLMVDPEAGSTVTVSTPASNEQPTTTTTAAPKATTTTTVAKATTTTSIVPVNTPAKQAVSNWGGYAATGKKFTGVSGSWTQPKVTCSGSQEQVGGLWVGLDGLGSNSVEQTGTSVSCNNGKATNYAWYEFFPAPPVYLTQFSVSAGDTISASVTNNNGTFALTLTDKSTTHQGWKFNTSTSIPNAPSSSAEWVIEAPAEGNGGQSATLPNFGTTSFTNCTATVNGKAEPVSQLSPTLLKLVDNHNSVKAQPSGLNASGNAFSLSFVG